MNAIKIEAYRQFASDLPVVILLIDGNRCLYDKKGINSLIEIVDYLPFERLLKRVLNELESLEKSRGQLKEIELDDISGQENLF